jgi:uncharacterized protein (TIGR00369 family)
MTRAPITRAALDRYAERCNAHSALQSLGVKVSFPELTLLQLTMPAVPPDMRGGLGDAAVVNGGVLSALCDVLIGCCCGMVDAVSRSATVQLNIRFERALRGASIHGQARVDRATQRLVFASAEISDEQGQVCVRCQGIATLVGEGARRVSGRPRQPEEAEPAESQPDEKEA